MTFRDRLLATVRAARPVLASTGAVIVGSEVPNLLQPGAASTLVVSQDLDIGVYVDRHASLKQNLDGLRDFVQSPDEPSVWIPVTPGLLELNFVGIDPLQDPAEAYVFDDDRLPLLVFGALSLLTTGPGIDLDGEHIPLPRPAGLLLEKLVTERTGEKGERDLLVALGLLGLMSAPDLEDLVSSYRLLRADLRHAIRSNLTILSLLEAREGMPDPRLHRHTVSELLGRLDAAETGR